MASPQKENGFTSIANELLGEILKSDFTLRELKIILTVIRFSYGFNRKQAELSVRFISEATGIKYHHISNSINTLIRKYVLTVNNSDNHKQGRVLKLNKDYETWNFDSYQKGNSYQKSNGSVTEKVTETVTEKVTKKENNKENINTSVQNEFERFWNLYDKKVSKEKSFKLWIKLKTEDKMKIFETLPLYVKSTPDKQYRKNPDTYLRNKSWKDEILTYPQQYQKNENHFVTTNLN